MAIEQTTGLTYDDLGKFPEDNLRRELIDGELVVTAAPSTRHQRAVAFLVLELGLYARGHGGEVFPAPTDVYFSDTNVVEPDVLFVRGDHAERVEKKFVRSAPDLVVEVSSPSTRRLELVRKRELYERFGVPEYWYVDLDADRIEVYRLHEGRYVTPALLGRGERLGSALLPGFEVGVGEALGPPEEDLVDG
ncbi:MAG: Uma2 family endonuclease [Actinomycetota bacterium]|nr:Uma2 family endonuclease [Actinomycetota bacterium]